MKKFLFISLSLLFILSGCGSSSLMQKLNETTGNTKHEYYLDFPDSAYTKTKLFEQSMLWVSKSWENTSTVIDYKDKDAGQIVIWGYIPKGINIVDSSLSGNNIGTRDQYFMYDYKYYSLSFKMIILTKNNQVKIEFVQVYPVDNYYDGKWYDHPMKEYGESKLVHSEAKKRFDNWINDFKINIDQNKF